MREPSIKIANPPSSTYSVRSLLVPPCCLRKREKREGGFAMAASGAGRLWLIVLLSCSLLMSSSLGARHHAGRDDDEEGAMIPRRHRGGERYGREEEAEEEEGRPQIDLGKPRDLVQSEGGRLRVWSEDVEAIRNSHIGIAELQLEEDGLLVPQYTDADKIAFVVEGEGVMGAVAPSAASKYRRRTFVRRVQRGDVIALPKGTVYWWYNDGNERHRVLCAGDTSLGANPGRFHQFGLAGSRQARFGSVLHGFSGDTLAEAWGVDHETIESLLEHQNDAGIVKARRRINFPEVPARGYEQRRRRDQVLELEEDDDEQANTMGNYGKERPAGSFYFEELKYSIREEHPDLYVENGGTLTQVSRAKLPALWQVGFSALKVSLEKNAMAAPCFVRNAHQLIYITRGGGRVQVASGDGRKVFDEEVQEGRVLVIPQFFPSLKMAGEQGLEYINLLSSDSPSIAYLAGQNSEYYGVPQQVMAAAFNVDEAQLRKLGRDEEIIFPAAESGRGGRRRKGESEEEARRRRRQREEEEERRRREREQEEERRRRRQHPANELPAWALSVEAF